MVLFLFQAKLRDIAEFETRNGSKKNFTKALSTELNELHIQQVRFSLFFFSYIKLDMYDGIGRLSI